MLNSPQIPADEPLTGAEILTKPEVATLLRVSVRTLDTWIKRGYLPCTRIGRSIRFSRAVLMRQFSK